MARISEKKGFYTKNISIGLAVSIVLLFVISFFNDIISGEIFLHDALPHYGQVMALTPQDFELTETFVAEETPTTIIDEETIVNEPQPPTTSAITVVGLNDVEIEQSTNYDDVMAAINTLNPRVLVPTNIDDLRNPDTLRNAMFIIDQRTLFVPNMFDIDTKLAKNLRVNPQSLENGDPVVLIFHTHTTEMFIDSDPTDMYTGIVGVGAYLAELLNAQGIPTMHYTRRFDIIDGQSHIFGAYERQEPYIERILRDNPSIEIVIDIHRDGMPESSPLLTTTIDGRQTARLMFVNGLSTRNVNGVATPISSLPNPHLPTNLAFSLQMQIALNEAHPSLNRRIYLNAFRYSTHFVPKSLFVEVGDQRSTLQEAKNAMYPLRDALIQVLYP
ncbi:MAG: stage II sporulation protein P [Defluviitaleaceae bacterium]|nr:stage II sporulation protein P [Defluviitaleaceae bacterium]